MAGKEAHIQIDKTASECKIYLGEQTIRLALDPPQPISLPEYHDLRFHFVSEYKYGPGDGEKLNWVADMERSFSDYLKQNYVGEIKNYSFFPDFDFLLMTSEIRMSGMDSCVFHLEFFPMESMVSSYDLELRGPLIKEIDIIFLREDVKLRATHVIDGAQQENIDIEALRKVSTLLFKAMSSRVKPFFSLKAFHSDLDFEQMLQTGPDGILAY